MIKNFFRLIKYICSAARPQGNNGIYLAHSVARQDRAVLTYILSSLGRNVKSLLSIPLLARQNKFNPRSRFHFVTGKSSPIVKYNLNFDDLLPNFQDFSLLEKLIEIFPQIKINVFIPIVSRDLEEKSNIFDYPDWLKKVSELSRAGNFEFSPHGYYHTADIGGKEAPEFKFSSKEEAKNLILKCEEALNRAGIRFVRGFRPPRWEMSKDCEEALYELGYVYLSDSPRFYEAHKDIKIPRIFSNSDIKYNEDYAEVAPLRNLLFPDPAKYYIQRGHLSPVTDNYLNKDALKNIIETIKLLQSFKEVEFKFLSEIAEEIHGSSD